MRALGRSWRWAIISKKSFIIEWPSLFGESAVMAQFLFSRNKQLFRWIIFSADLYLTLNTSWSLQLGFNHSSTFNLYHTLLYCTSKREFRSWFKQTKPIKMLYFIQLLQFQQTWLKRSKIALFIFCFFVATARKFSKHEIELKRKKETVEQKQQLGEQEDPVP